MEKNKAATDFYLGIGVVVFGIAVFIISSALPTATTGLGSRGYPRFLSILMIILGLALAIPVGEKLFKGKLEGGLKIQFSGIGNQQAFIKTVVCIVASFLYVFLMNKLGFLLTTPIFLFGLMMLFGYSKYTRSVAISILLPVIVYFLFNRVFYIYLPTFQLF